MRILLICLSGAGDVLMTTPTVKEIRKIYPKAHIDYLVMQGKAAEGVLKNNKFIDKVIYFNFQQKGIIKSLQFIKKLRKNKYSLSITFYPQARYHYSVISYLIGAKTRIGFSYASRKIDLNKFFFHKTLEEKFNIHCVENNLKIISLLNGKREVKGELHNPIDKKSIKSAEKYFKKNKIKRAVVIHAGSGTTKNFYLKRWPVERFAEITRKLKENKGIQIILVGGSKERELNETIIKESKLKKNKEIFLFRGNIEEVAAIIKKARLVISNDTIMGHLAAAVGTPVVALFGPTSWENSGPYTKNKKILCKRPKCISPYMHGAKKISRKQAD